MAAESPNDWPPHRYGRNRAKTLLAKAARLSAGCAEAIEVFATAATTSPEASAVPAFTGTTPDLDADQLVRVLDIG